MSKKSKETSTKSRKKKYIVEAFGKKTVFKRTADGQDYIARVNPDVVPDSEKVNPEPDDEFASHKYPPPKKHPTFRKVWGQFIDSIVSRDNFKVGHLNNLEILCDSYVEYEQLQEFIRTHGRSYVSVGRNGEVWKLFPEVAQLSRVQLNIKNYTTMLGLNLKKDDTPNAGNDESWE